MRAFAEFATETQRGRSKKTDAEAVECWYKAVEALKPWIIRHTIAGLDNEEKASFGELKKWEIEVPPTDEETIEILARTDRLLNLSGGPKEIKGFRGSDPRFHVGWQYLRHPLIAGMGAENLPQELKSKSLRVLHLKVIREKLSTRLVHPKVEAIVRRVVDDREKVVVFCHHIATMHEVADALRSHPRLNSPATVWETDGKEFRAWSCAWQSMLASDPHLDTRFFQARETRF